MTKNYIKNLETGKIELHFSKPEYQALSDELKKEIKSSYLFSGIAKAWVSRSVNNQWRAIQTAKKLGFTEEEKTGERLTFAEQLERKQEKAEHRAERYDQYADNAEKRAENFQADFNQYRKDWSWLTQPIIHGHSGSRAFGNHKAKVIARYEKGFEEYQKSDYYKERACTARATANNSKLQNKVYLVGKIKESNKQVKTYQDIVVKYEEALYKIQQGEELKNRSGEILTEIYIEQKIDDMLEKYEWEYDKLEFFEKCLKDIGGVQFSKDNIKVGYIVNIKRWGKCEIVSTGPKNIQFKILEGGASGGMLIDPYAAIVEILETNEVEEVKAENPFKIGDIVCKHRPADNSIYRAFQIVKTTDKSVTIQRIEVLDHKPIKDTFISDQQERKQVKKDRGGNFVINHDDWYLYKYSA